MKSVRRVKETKFEADPDQTLHHRHFLTSRVKKGGSPTLDRIPLLFNQDIAMLYVEPDKNDEHFYRNAQADELVYVSKGNGNARDGVRRPAVSAKATISSSIAASFTATGIDLEGEQTKLRGLREPRTRAVAQAVSQRVRPAHRRRAVLRARHPPARSSSQPHDEMGDFPALVKQYDGINEIMLDHHPFDVVGWDGYFYPWAFNIMDFEPIVGRVHQPPPVHQTFQGDGFVVCSFCPRPYDFHPEAVPAPYNHSNVDSDEVLYYASSEFMSRKGIEFGSITHHPDGIPHGPHPGRAEASIGAKYTDELAVMMDSFRPLKVAKQALDIEDKNYHKSWLDAQHAQFNPPTSEA